MTQFIAGNTDQLISFVAVDSTDFTTLETGLGSFTVYRMRNGGTPTAYTTPTVTEVDSTNMPGVYKLLLDEDMSLAAGNDMEEVVLRITQASMAPVTLKFDLVRAKATEGYTLGVGSDGDLLEVNTLTGHTAQTGDNYARLGAPAGASVSADVAAVKSDSAAILVDTAEIGTAGAGLTALASAANLATVAGYLDTEIAAILLDTGTTIPGLLAALETHGDGAWTTATGFSTHSAADVRAEIDSNSTQLAAILTDTAEIGTAGAGLTALATASALATVDSNVDAIKAKTDSLTFTVAGQVDANIQYVNDVAVTGDGQSGTEWGPA